MLAVILALLFCLPAAAQAPIPADLRGATIGVVSGASKQFTALMLWQLVERQKARFSDPVEKYFPEVNQLGGRFTGALATAYGGPAR